VVGVGDGIPAAGQREHDDLKLVVDPIAQQPTDFGDQLAAHAGRAAPQQPVEPALERAGRERRAGQLLDIRSELQRQRDQERHGQAHA
jgi:hypothetical protein